MRDASRRSLENTAEGGASVDKLVADLDAVRHSFADILSSVQKWTRSSPCPENSASVTQVAVGAFRM